MNRLFLFVEKVLVITDVKQGLFTLTRTFNNKNMDLGRTGKRILRGIQGLPKNRFLGLP